LLNHFKFSGDAVSYRVNNLSERIYLIMIQVKSAVSRVKYDIDCRDTFVNKFIFDM
jgi:hypothetical protein